MRKIKIIVIMCCIILGTCVGCGASQEDYDKLQTEKNELDEELTTNEQSTTEDETETQTMTEDETETQTITEEEDTNFRNSVDLYDYETGEQITTEFAIAASELETQNEEKMEQITSEIMTETKTEEIEKLEEEVPHRDGMCGISDKDISDIDGTFRANRVRNDATGNWRISTIAANVDLQEYALSYYKWKFHRDDEVHGIVNFNYRTTTSITKFADILYVDVYEYVDGEEHDAQLLFSGTLLKQYLVYLDNGDIEEVQ